MTARTPVAPGYGPRQPVGPPGYQRLLVAERTSRPRRRGVSWSVLTRDSGRCGILAAMGRRHRSPGPDERRFRDDGGPPADDLALAQVGCHATRIDRRRPARGRPGRAGRLRPPRVPRASSTATSGCSSTAASTSPTAPRRTSRCSTRSVRWPTPSPAWRSGSVTWWASTRSSPRGCSSPCSRPAAARCCACSPATPWARAPRLPRPGRLPHLRGLLEAGLRRAAREDHDGAVPPRLPDPARTPTVGRGRCLRGPRHADLAAGPGRRARRPAWRPRSSTSRTAGAASCSGVRRAAAPCPAWRRSCTSWRPAPCPGLRRLRRDQRRLHPPALPADPTRGDTWSMLWNAYHASLLLVARRSGGRGGARHPGGPGRATTHGLARWRDGSRSSPRAGPSAPSGPCWR